MRFIVLIPIGFAVAILQYEMLGIRRLIHRGMVYGVTGTILLAAVSLVFGASHIRGAITMVLLTTVSRIRPAALAVSHAQRQ